MGQCGVEDWVVERGWVTQISDANQKKGWKSAFGGWIL